MRVQQPSLFFDSGYMKNKTLTLLALIFLFQTNAFAHGKEHHGTPSVIGTVIFLEGDKFQVKTNTGEVVTATLFKETVFEAGHDGQPAKREDLKVGSEVMIVGPKLDTDSVAAKEVMIHDTPKAKAPVKAPYHGNKGH